MSQQKRFGKNVPLYQTSLLGVVSLLHSTDIDMCQKSLLTIFLDRYSPKDIEPYVKLDFKTILDFYPAQCYSGTP